MSALLRHYLELERDMMSLDDANNEQEADKLRDVMDLVWRKLTESEKHDLNQRELAVLSWRPRIELNITNFFFEAKELRPPDERHQSMVVADDDFWCNAA